MDSRRPCSLTFFIASLKISMTIGDISGLELSSFSKRAIAYGSSDSSTMGSSALDPEENSFITTVSAEVVD